MFRTRSAVWAERFLVVVVLAVLANIVSRATGWPLLYVLIVVVWGGAAVHAVVRSRHPHRSDAVAQHAGEQGSVDAERD